MKDQDQKLLAIFGQLSGKTAKEHAIAYMEAMLIGQEALRADFGLPPESSPVTGEAVAQARKTACCGDCIAAVPPQDAA
jgi:hypothetical protein